MRNKFLILVGALSLPMVSFSQTVYLYNAGKMSVVSANTTDPNDNPVLYINGNLMTAGNCEIYVKNSKTILTGDFIHNVLPDDLPGAGYKNVFKYEGTAQTPADGIEGTTVVPPLLQNKGNRTRAIFEFKGGSVAQRIKTSVLGNQSSAAFKAKNYIAFPDVKVNTTGHVIAEPHLSLSIQNLHFENGRLILDSEPLKTVKNDDQNNSGRTSIAHLYMPKPSTPAPIPPNKDGVGFIYYHENTDPGIGWNAKNGGEPSSKPVSDFNAFGSVQVNLAVDDPSEYGTEAERKNGRSLIGMGSPYKQIYSDYFMWNFLFIPKGNDFLSHSNPAIWSPIRELKAGEGFVIGVDLRGGDTEKDYYIYDLHDELEGKGLDFNQRVKQKYSFGRFNFNNGLAAASDGFANNVHRIPHAASITNLAKVQDKVIAKDKVPFQVEKFSHAAYAQEVINNDDVPVTIQPGWNFLANPYLTPLNLAPLMTTGAKSQWGVTVGTGSTGDIVNRVWVMSPDAKASSEFDIAQILPDNRIPLNRKRIVVSAKYRLMKGSGSTTATSYSSSYEDGASGETFTIAPLQMFVLHGETAVTGGKTLKIPHTQRVMGATPFLRSASSSETALRNDFMFEVYDHESKETSRTSIVLRSPQEVLNTDDVKKLTSVIQEYDGEKWSTKTDLLEGKIVQSYSSFLYTMSDSTTALEAKYVPFTPSIDDKVEVGLYLMPSTVSQNVTINAYRLNTKVANEIEEIRLHDKKNNKEVILTPANPSYTTSTSPDDNPKRFIVKFIRNTDGIGPDQQEEEAKSIIAGYGNNEVRVTGFQDIDLGSTLSVYNIQGRLLNQTKVDGYEVRIPQSLIPGVYLVKVVGNKSHVVKFLVK